MSACVRALKYYYSPPLIVFFCGGQQTNRKFNSHDVISRTSGTKCGSFSAIIRDHWTKFATEFKKQTTIMAERAKFTYRRNTKFFQYFRIGFTHRYHRIPDWISTKFGGQMHHGHTKMIADALIILSITARWLSAYIYSIALATNTTSSLRNV